MNIDAVKRPVRRGRVDTVSVYIRIPNDYMDEYAVASMRVAGAQTYGRHGVAEFHAQ